MQSTIHKIYFSPNISNICKISRVDFHFPFSSILSGQIWAPVNFSFSLFQIFVCLNIDSCENTNCSAWLKLNPKLGLDNNHHHHHHPTPPPQTFQLKFCTEIHYTNLIQLANYHCDICQGNICPGDVCPYQEYLIWFWHDSDQTLKVGSLDHV